MTWYHLWAPQVSLVVKNPPVNTGGSREEKDGNPFQYSYLENPMDRGT